jgi:hypothetical protein
MLVLPGHLLRDRSELCPTRPQTLGGKNQQRYRGLRRGQPVAQERASRVAGLGTQTQQPVRM